MTEYLPARGKTIYPTLRTRILVPYFLLALAVAALITYGISSYMQEILQNNRQHELQNRGEMVRLLLTSEQQRQQLAWYETTTAVQPPTAANPTSLSALAQQLAAAAGAHITFYNSQGDILATTHTTSADASLALSPATVSQISSAANGQQRFLELLPQNYDQILLSLEHLLGQPSRQPLEQPGSDLALVGVSLPQQPFTNQINNARRLMLATLLLTIAASLVIGYVSAIHIGRPIKALMEASQQVAAGNLEVQLNHPTPDEIGQLTRSFNNMVSQLRQRRYLEDLFGRYVGDNIAQRILNGEAELGGQRVWATALFADIRDFTAFTQKVDLNALLDELNEYYTTMQRVIDAHGGVVNKFGGDSMLALFGVPIPSQNHAQQAIDATMAMMEELSELNNQRLARGVAPIRIGIGVNTGEMIVGNLGSEKRREYTVLGDSVNLAKRFSDLNKETPFDTVFMGETTLSHLETVAVLQIDDLGLVRVKGKVEPVRVYSVMRPVRLLQGANAAPNITDRARQSGSVFGFSSFTLL